VELRWKVRRFQMRRVRGDPASVRTRLGPVAKEDESNGTHDTSRFRNTGAAQDSAPATDFTKRSAKSD